MDKSEFWRGYDDALDLTYEPTDEDWASDEYKRGYSEGMKFFMPH